LAIFIILVSCLSSKNISPTSTVAMSTSTSNELFIPENTFTETHTVIITKTKTPKPTRTITNTRYNPPFISTMEQSNIEQTKTSIEIGSQNNDKCNKLYSYSVSPTNNWIICISSESTDSEYKYLVISQKSNVIWILSYSGLLGEENANSVSGIFVAYWSLDDKYLYILTPTSGDGGDPIFHGGKLFRLKLSNGNISPILNDKNYVFKISPSGNLLVYHEEQYSESLYIRNLVVNETNTIQMPNEWSYGWFLWSPNEEMIVMSSIKYTDSNGYQYSQYLVNIIDKEVRQIFIKEQSNLNLKAIAWDGNEKIIFVDSEKAFSGQVINQYWEYDIKQDLFIEIVK
jgi:hypothetical protein